MTKDKLKKIIDELEEFQKRLDREHRCNTCFEVITPRQKRMQARFPNYTVRWHTGLKRCREKALNNAAHMSMYKTPVLFKKGDVSEAILVKRK